MEIPSTQAGYHPGFASLDGRPQIRVGVEMREDHLAAFATSQKAPETGTGERAIIHHDQRSVGRVGWLQLVVLQSYYVREHTEHDEPSPRNGGEAEPA
jgi:hypothetical protein